MKLNNVELTYQDTGTNIAVCMIGNEGDINLQFNSFWNHGATSGELHWTTSFRAYFWTKEKKLKKALINGALAYILNNYPEKFKGKKGGALALARYLGRRRFREMPRQSQLVYTHQTLEEYSLGTITAEFSDTCNLNYQSAVRHRSFDVMKKTVDTLTAKGAGKKAY
jgi:hypothetical protein|tara:strand:- start:210 stop:710 length:501 start_codon:yes stop_codon:yes gene_type:complete